MSEHRIGQVARMSGVSVRTLRHYDEIGLLVPGGRSEAGYRLYSGEDLARLRKVLFYRELDFGLEEIAEIMAGPEDGGDGHLRRQHRLLRARLARTELLITAIENEMEAREMGISLTPEEQLEIFGTDKLAEHRRQAEERWGDTEAWRESERRSSAYTKGDWIEIKRQADANIAGFAAALRAGMPADGPRAMELAEEHRRHISRWFYECSPQRHRGLARLYISDPRYMRPHDELTPGFSQYVHDAILANADAHR